MSWQLDDAADNETLMWVIYRKLTIKSCLQNDVDIGMNTWTKSKAIVEALE